MLINCPECEKEVSEKTFKCPNCGVVINKPKRGFTGILFKSLFIIFNAFMILAIGAAFMSSSTLEAGITTGMIFYLWIMIGLPLALLSYLTRPKPYE